MHIAGSIFKYLRSKQHGDVQSQQPQQPQKRSSAGLPPKTVAATGSSTPGLLAVASPNKTWVGVTGAIILGTATALVLEGLACRLSASEPVQDCFSVSALNRDLLCATGVVICAVGIVGDLWESLLKRAAMVKASGRPCSLLCKAGTGLARSGAWQRGFHVWRQNQESPSVFSKERRSAVEGSSDPWLPVRGASGYYQKTLENMGAVG